MGYASFTQPPGVCLFQYIVAWSADASFPSRLTSNKSAPPGWPTVIPGLSPGVQYYVRVAAVPPSYPGVPLPAGMSLPLLWAHAPGCTCTDAAADAECPPLQPYTAVMPVIGKRCGHATTRINDHACSQ